MVRASVVLAVVLGSVGGALSGCSILYSTDAISSETNDGGRAADADADVGGPSLCNTSDFLFCDGFENGLGATQSEVGGGSATVNSTNVYRGAFALRSSIPATSSGARIVAQAFQEQAWPPRVFIRLFAFFPPPLPPQGATLVNYLDVTRSAGLVLYTGGDDQALHLSTFGFPNAGTVISATRTPLGQWVCFEMEVDSVAHLVNVRMNDKALGDLSVMVPLGQLRSLSFGLTYEAPPAGPAYDAWFDEVAVDTRPIGCMR